MFKKVTEDAILPTRGSKYAACVDVYANEDVIVESGETKIIGIGIAINLDGLFFNLYGKNIHDDIDKNILRYFELFLQSNYLQLNPRSGLRAKGILSNTGIIDLDYKDEIKMIIHNPIKQSSILFQDEYSAEIKNRVVTKLSINKNDKFVVKKGDRIGQLTLIEHSGYLFGINSEDDRIGGFGSTGER